MMTSLGRFGDRRLENGGAFLLDRLLGLGQCGISLRALGGDRAGEVRLDRFLKNPKVTPAEMVATARAHLLERVQGREVLVIQDTTSLRDDGNKRGLYLHPAIAVDAADGALLGLLSADFLVRDETPKAHCNKRRLEQKESRRWVDVTGQAADLLTAGASGVTVIADREADLYEMFACRPEGVEVLVRAHHNRVLTDGGWLDESCAGQPELGRTTVKLPAIAGRAARVATLALRACRISIKRPKRNRARWAKLPKVPTGLPAGMATEGAALPASVDLTLVEAREIDTPAGETPLHWRLLTTRTVENLADAQMIVGFYRCRWTIEQVFRVMKTRGFDIEAVPIRENAPLKNLGCATLIAAIQIQQMLHDRDGLAARPMTDVFDPDDQPLIEAIGTTLEGRTAHQRNPYPSGSLAHATWICARLGGWTGYYGKPGPIVLVRGHMRLLTMLEGIKRSGLVRIP
jgi:DDE family transposase